MCMDIRAYLPSTILRPYIQGYRVIESGESVVNRVLPDTAISLAFRFKGEVSYLVNDQLNPLPSAVFSGLLKSARLINYKEQTGNIIVKFKAGGAAAFFREPLYELFGQTIPLEELAGLGSLALLEAQLMSFTSDERRIGVIEHFLLSRLRENQDRLILEAIQRICRDGGHARIRTLADSFYLSQDAFEKRFRKTVGASPKQFSSIVRLRSVVDRGRSGENLTRIALEAGYFDQSHFNKDFLVFTGQTPKNFFRSPRL
jgi:AraC-like DNA-binding protein